MLLFLKRFLILRFLILILILRRLRFFILMFLLVRKRTALSVLVAPVAVQGKIESLKTQSNATFTASWDEL